jgi:hypothetical protein
MLSTSKIGDVEGGSIPLTQRQSAKDKPSKWFEVLSNNRKVSFVLECNFRNSENYHCK